MSEGISFTRTREPLTARIREALLNPYAVVRELNNRSFYHFLEYFWPVVSAHTFQPNWHIEYLCQELEKIAMRVGEKLPREYDLIINVPPGSTKPVWEEMDVLMGDGTYRKLKDIKEGDFVINRHGSATKVIGVHIQGELPCVKIHTFGGRDIITAYDHPILTADGWVNAIDIKEGQMLALMHTAKIKTESKRTVDEFRLAGYIIGDGSVSSKNFSVCGTDMDYINDLTSCLDRLNFAYRKGIDKNGVTVVGIRNDKENARQWLRDIGLQGKTSKTKYIPDFVWKGSDEQIKAFLASYFQCDGCVSYRDSNKRNVLVSMTSISKELIYGLQRLFLRVGVSMKIRNRIQKNGYAYNPNLKDYVYYTLDTTDQDSVVRFFENIPLIGYKKQKLITFAPQRRTFEQSYWPDKVERVEKIEILPCRCLSVNEGESFVVDGVVVHNTITCSIMFPVWCWTKWYSMRFITASYSGALSLESAEYCRELVRSTEFQTIYPELDIKEDKDTKSNFRIIKRLEGTIGRNSRFLSGGSRYSTSVGGTLTGFHGDILIIDDPLNPAQAASDIELGNANHWCEQTLSTRKTNKDITPTIYIMQRLHQDDPSGHLLAKQKENIKHICIPGECRTFPNQVKPPELIKNYIDDLMDPKRLSWSALKDMEADLGQYGYAGQVGQDPTPPGGGMFKVDNFAFINTMPESNKISHTVRYWDKAATEKGKGPFTVGVKMCKTMDGRWIVLDVRRGRWASHEREAIIKQTAEADGIGVDIWIEQEPGSGGKESAEGTIRNLAGFVCKAHRPTGAEGDKPRRADAYSVQVNNKAFMILTAIWNREFIEEHRFFPFSTYKDQVDAAAGAFNKLVGKKIARRIT